MKYVWAIKVSVRDENGHIVALSQHHTSPIENEPSEAVREALHVIERAAWDKILFLAANQPFTELK